MAAPLRQGSAPPLWQDSAPFSRTPLLPFGRTSLLSAGLRSSPLAGLRFSFQQDSAPFSRTPLSFFTLRPFSCRPWLLPFRVSRACILHFRHVILSANPVILSASEESTAACRLRRSLSAGGWLPNPGCIPAGGWPLGAVALPPVGQVFPTKCTSAPPPARSSCRDRCHPESPPSSRCSRCNSAAARHPAVAAAIPPQPGHPEPAEGSERPGVSS